MHDQAYFQCSFANIFRSHVPGPPYNGLAFGTLHNIDLWRHSAKKTLGPHGNFLRTPLGADINFV